MTVLIGLIDGTSKLLDRNLRLDQVAEKVNEARGKGKLIDFQDNQTPSRLWWVDPDAVISINDDGFTY